MFLSRRLPLAALIELCRFLRVSLGAGLMLRDVFARLASSGARAIRPMAGRVRKRLERGDDLSTALQSERAALPQLLRAMAAVGEQTGQMPEVFDNMESYYRLQQKQLHYLRIRLVPIVAQTIIALGIIALMIFITGVIGAANGGAAPAVFGFRGAEGAILFFSLSVGALAAAWVGCKWLPRVLGHRAAVDGMLLGLPVIGPCVRDIVLARFCLAMQMTMDSAMPVAEALRMSLQATGNAAFAGQADDIVAAVEEHDGFAEALGRGAYMPIDFLTMVAVAEESGRLVEVMRDQAAHYNEEAGRRMEGATRLATGFFRFGFIALMALAILRLGADLIGRRHL